MAISRQLHKYIIIYVFSRDAHPGLLKIGKTSAMSTSAEDLASDTEKMTEAVKLRYKDKITLGVNDLHIHHMEVGYFRTSEGEFDFDDNAVFRVLKNSHYPNEIIEDDWGEAQEWYRIDLNTAKKAIKAVKDGLEIIEGPKIEKEEHDKVFFRKEQEKAIIETETQFTIGEKMLWNAKMRFGKTLCALELINRLDKAKQTLILTHRPAVKEGWFEDYHLIEFKHPHQYGSKKGTRYACIDNKEKFPEEYYSGKDLATLQEDLATKDIHYIYFASMQDLRGKEQKDDDEKTWKENNAMVYSTKWDLVVYDEAHEGTQTALGQEVIKNLNLKNTPKSLYLSGTPFNIQNHFVKDEIYTWDYIMEQEAKVEWPIKHPGEKNPYEGLAKLNIYTYNLADLFDNNPDYIKSDEDYFNFTEFFRVWTGDIVKDEGLIPDGAKKGHFVHENDVVRFLDMLCKEEPVSYYPFSNEELRKTLSHTLWMLPSVASAERLATLILSHQLHKEYGFTVVNVAGEGKVISETDDEESYVSSTKTALNKVKDAIAGNDRTITLSCGRLNTGVSIPEWTGVFMLSGGYKTSAATYMQTIFRGQTPYKDDRIKKDCFAFDFAPDRTLTVINDYIKSQPRSRNVNPSPGEETRRVESFLRFCSVISMSGGKEVEYNAQKFITDVYECLADDVVNNGFKVKKLLKGFSQFTENDYEIIAKIGNAIKAGKRSKKGSTDVVMADNDYKGDEASGSRDKRDNGNKISTKKKKTEKDELEERKKRSQIILDEIFTRLPLLMFGAVTNTDGLTINELLDKIIDDESWSEFMPKGLTKPLFKEIAHLVNTDVLISSTNLVINGAKEADAMSVAQRVRAIAAILKKFHFPDRETILTDWWVVNMHMTDTLGGYDFFDETHKIQLDEPRLVEQGDITVDVFCNPDTKILELNSKSGIYPLWLAYTLWKLIGEKNMTPEREQKIWKQVVERNLFVVTRTKMAEKITRRVLAGYNSDIHPNILCIENIVEILKSRNELLYRNLLITVSNSSNYGKNNEDMNIEFDAIVGNPPYQVISNSDNQNRNPPIYHKFILMGRDLQPNFLSLITPARWYAPHVLMDRFCDKFLPDKRIKYLHDFTNAKEIFPSVEIKSGISYFLWNKSYDGECDIDSNLNGRIEHSRRFLPCEYENTYIRYSQALPILKKVMTSGDVPFADVVSPQNPFGFNTAAKGTKTKGSNSVTFYSLGLDENYIERDSVRLHSEWIDKYKVLTPKAAEDGVLPGKVISKIHLIKPGTCCNGTYLVLRPSENEIECIRVIKYLKTRFCRFLIGIKKMTQDLKDQSFLFVPMQDFSTNEIIDWDKPINDIERQLYKKYEIEEPERELIESLIKPME